jgi:hypothetical protein
MWIAVKHAEYFAGNNIGFHLFVAQILHAIVLFRIFQVCNQASIS